MALDPTGPNLRRFLDEDPGGACVMLNLLRYRPDGGREGYQRYVEAFTPFAHRYGAQTVYVGEGGAALVAEDGQAWDSVLLVRYPNRQAFSDMVRDPEYQAITHLRSDSLIEAVLQPTSPW